MRIIALSITLLVISNCSKNSEFDPVGYYSLEVEGIRSIDKGSLEIFGEADDYFGLLRFEGTRNREYSVGIEFISTESMSFYLSGDGYLRIVRQENRWTGEFKYFGLNGTIQTDRIEPLKSIEEGKTKQITALKPIGRGVISTNEQETFPTFDPNRNSLFFTRSDQLFETSLNGENWSPPIPLSFSSEFSDSAPYLSSDGETMIFTSTRPAFGATNAMRKNIWKSTRDSEGNWQSPTVYPFPINIDSLGEYHAAISANNSLYFVSYNRNGGFGRSDLYKASESNFEYSVDNLGPIINTEFSEADVYIDPDERFLLFISTSRSDTYGLDDIYISINENGEWSSPENLGPSVNTYAYEYGPWIDPLNKEFYFNSDRRGSADIYSVPISEIPLLKPFFD
jgi:hypothetical protein